MNQPETNNLEICAEEIHRCVAGVESNGDSILVGALALEFCDEIIEEKRGIEAVGQPLLPANAFTGFETVRCFDLLNKAEVWQRVATLPCILQVVRRVIGDDMLLATLGTAVIGPNETVQPVHCDDALYGIWRLIGFRPSAYQAGHINAGDPMQVLDGVEPDPA